MVIAINSNPLNSGPLNRDRFIYNILKLITSHHPEHNFLFLLDRPARENLVFSSNVKTVIVSPAIKNSLLHKFWLDVKIPVALKKNNADIYVTFDNYCSLTSAVPQCMVVLENKKSNLKFFRKAKSIAVLADFFKSGIANSLKIPADKIDVIFAAAGDIYKSINRQDKERVKEQYSDGREFFLFNGDTARKENFINLLKAFSQFKKRQQSNMQLLLAEEQPSAFLHDLETYKYRQDIKLIGNIDEKELAAITASAYAMIHTFTGPTSSYLSVLEAMQCGVPVIVVQEAAVKEIAGDSVLYTGDTTVKELAEKMMRIYTDENLREKLAEKGKKVAAQYTLQKSAVQLWQTIIKAIN